MTVNSALDLFSVFPAGLGGPDRACSPLGWREAGVERFRAFQPAPTTQSDGKRVFAGSFGVRDEFFVSVERRENFIAFWCARALGHAPVSHMNRANSR